MSEDYRDKYPLSEVILRTWESGSEEDRDYVIGRAYMLETELAEARCYAWRPTDKDGS